MNNDRSRRAAAAVLVALILGACSLELPAESEEKARPLPTVTFEPDAAPIGSSTVADVVERSLPSVVNVRVTSVDVDAFGEVIEGQGQGSGVVIDRSGVILTNNHVIAGAVDVEVVFNDGEHGTIEGEVLGTAPEKDLAVIRVEEDDLTPIRLGRSSNLRLGDDVVAIGFPLGLGESPTVTKGIVSAKERTIQPSDAPVERLEGLLQTDAAINPGNSGGALIDLGGRLVGINTAAAQAGAAENIGFAIPIDDALPVVEEILSEPPEERAWLGVYVQTLEPAVAAQLGYEVDLEGALLVGIVPGGPADAAGLAEGEVVTRVGDTEVRADRDLTEALTELDPGDEVEVEVVAPDGVVTLDVTLTRRPPSF